VLLAMGHDAAVAGSGLRISLGSWHRAADLEELPAALERARSRLGGAPG
jgi:cysteine sulfinate desulfinase/cysteine desulfurase-like protein